MNKRQNLLFLLIVLLSVHSSVLESTAFVCTSKNIMELKSQVSRNTELSYLIITDESLVTSLKPLAQWKTQRGIRTTIVTVQSIENQYTEVDRAANIKAYIRDIKEDYPNSLQWILLAGDTVFIPTRLITYRDNELNHQNDRSVRPYWYTDWYYADLDNNWDSNGDRKWGVLGEDEFDFTAEVFIGRWPISTSDEATHLVNRLLKYEKSPTIGTAWYNRMITATAIVKFPEDNNDDDISKKEDGEKQFVDANGVANWVIDKYLPNHWTAIRLGEEGGILPTIYESDKPLSKNNLLDTLSEGATAVYLSGHGSRSAIYRYYLRSDLDGDKLKDGNDKTTFSPFFMEEESIPEYGTMYPLFWIGACLVGSFLTKLGDPCLAEQIIKNIGIGVIASMNIAKMDFDWEDDHFATEGGLYLEGLETRFWKAFYEDDIYHPGQCNAITKERYWNFTRNMNHSQDWPQYYPGWELRTLMNFNLLGDPEVPIWTDIPMLISMNMTKDSESVTFIVTNEQGPLADVCVTVMGQNNYYRKLLTDENGIAQFSNDWITLGGNISITASGHNIIPLEAHLNEPYQDLIISDRELPVYPFKDSYSNKQEIISGFEIGVISISCIFILVFIIRSHKRKRK